MEHLGCLSEKKSFSKIIEDSSFNIIMLRNIIIYRRKKSKLHYSMTLNEVVRDSLIKAGIKAVKEAIYSAGNKTEKMVKLSQHRRLLSAELHLRQLKTLCIGLFIV